MLRKFQFFNVEVIELTEEYFTLGLNQFGELVFCRKKSIHLINYFTSAEMGECRHDLQSTKPPYKIIRMERIPMISDILSPIIYEDGSNLNSILCTPAGIESPRST